jgi:acetylornithine/succinyldiaminopimelate/putrescine aminotransferase
MSNLVGNYGRYDVSFVKGNGCFLYDDAGKEYLDFGCGISVTSLGHSHPAVTKAITEQAAALIHTSNLYRIPLQEKLGSRLSELSFGGKVFFCNSGAEANEAAFKIARIYGNKNYEGLKPIADWFVHVPNNDFESVRKACDKGDVSAVCIELIQGEGGVYPVEKGFLDRLRTYCDKKDIILIFDEIQTSMGRAGHVFGYENYGVEPDILTVAKALGNGVPIGAAIARAKYADFLVPGTHGTTFGGNPLVCAVGNAVLDELTKEGFLEEVRKKGVYLKDRLKVIFDGKAVEVRGTGLMLGVQFEENMKSFVNGCLAEGLLLIPAGCETVRIYPPINIS